MNRKLLFFAGGILIIIIVVAGLMIYISKKNKGDQQPSENINADTAASKSGGQSAYGTPPRTGDSGQQKGQPLKISDSVVVSPTWAYDQKSVWYFSPDGHLYKQSIETGLKQEYLLPSNFKVDNVIWPGNGNDFIAETRNAAIKTFNYYNSKAKTYSAYPSNVRSVDFMPDGTHVAYEWIEENGKGGLSIADASLKGHQRVVDLPDADDIIKVSPSGNKALAYKSNAPADGKVYYITLDTKKIYPIKTAASNLAVWSADGQKFIFTKLGPDNNKSSTTLWLGDSVSGVDKPLNISVPLFKLAFDSSGKNLYFAAPGSEGSGETFWKMDLSSLEKRQIYAGSPALLKLDASNILVQNDGKLLLFTNTDGFLYSVTTQ